MFDDSLSACKGARAAKMRVVGVYDGFFAQDEAAMRGFCDVYIRSFEELLLPPRAGTPPMSGLPEALETAREAGEVLSAAVLSQENAEGLDGSGLDFRDCRFQSCRLRNCDFTAQPFTAAPSPDVSWRTAASPPPIGRTAASPAANGTARTCAAPGGRTAFWRRLCFVMSTFPAASGSVFP